MLYEKSAKTDSFESFGLSGQVFIHGKDTHLEKSDLVLLNQSGRFESAVPSDEYPEIARMLVNLKAVPLVKFDE